MEREFFPWPLLLRANKIAVRRLGVRGEGEQDPLSELELSSITALYQPHDMIQAKMQAHF